MIREKYIQSYLKIVIANWKDTKNKSGKYFAW